MIPRSPITMAGAAVCAMLAACGTEQQPQGGHPQREDPAQSTPASPVQVITPAAQTPVSTPVVPPEGYPGTDAEADEAGRLSARMEELVEKAHAQGLTQDEQRTIMEAQERVEKTLASVTSAMPREEYGKVLNEARRITAEAEKIVNRDQP